MTVTSVFRGTNAELIAEVAKLWIAPDDRVMDVTYGKGKWWTVGVPMMSFVAHDLRLDNVDFRQLPEPDGTKDIIAFDPPYVAKGGRATSGIPEMDDRYGMRDAPRTPDEMMKVNSEGLLECARVLAPGGRLLVKSADYISSGEFVNAHWWVHLDGQVAGLELVDEFVHVTGPGPQPKGRCQVHSRRAHSFLDVFRKGK